KIIQATHVYIVSNRSTMSLGTFLQYYLDLLFGKSELIHTTASAFDRIRNVSEEEVFIGISFARYTKCTIDILFSVIEHDASIIVLTNEFSSTISAFADISLFSSIKMPSFLDSFVAPLSVINVLIACIGNHESIDVDKRLEDFENLWDRY